MKSGLRIFATAGLIFILLAIALGVYKALNGDYLQNASFITIGIYAFLLIAVAAAIVFGITRLWKNRNWLLMLTLPFVLEACSYAKSNQQVVVSSDCGMTWKKIDVGGAVPKGVGNRCFMKVVMPSYPMQGESKFVSNFKEKVRANIHIDYDYSITEPLAFIKQAKYLGTANTDADSEEALNAKVFETAENSVIDKRIREVVKGLLINEDIVDADQAELENQILDRSNKILDPLGVRLNFITLTFDLDEQTRQAIDVATAMKIYETKSLGDVGRSVVSARAGATKITIETRNEPSRSAE